MSLFRRLKTLFFGYYNFIGKHCPILLTPFSNEPLHKAKHRKQAGENTWEQSFQYTQEMSSRIQRMISLLEGRNVQSLMDIGCGYQECKKWLPETTDYYPVDLHPHIPSTHIKDLNAGEFLEIAVDVVFCSGVLEYIYDLEALLEKIGCYSPAVLCSYCNTDTHPGRSPLWVNHLSHSDFVKMWERHGFTLTQDIPPDKKCTHHIYYFGKQ